MFFTVQTHICVCVMTIITNIVCYEYHDTKNADYTHHVEKAVDCYHQTTFHYVFSWNIYRKY